MAREQKQDAPAVELVHPVYLDVPMLVSFVAAIEGGVAFGSEQTEKGATTQERSREGAGRARAGFPSIGALVGMDVSGRYGRKDQEQDSKETKIVRQHTEASLFNLLRHELRSDGRITSLTGKSQLQEHGIGELVEVTGEIIGNPLQQMLALFLQLLPYLGYDIDMLSQPKKRKEPRSSRSGNPAKRAAAAQEATAGNGEPDMSDEDMFRLMATMRQDLERGSIRDLVLQSDEGMRAVLTLSSEFLTDTAAEYLLGGRFSVIGKVTRVLAEGESINLTRRTAIGLAGPEMSTALVSELRDIDTLFVEIGDPIVEPPAVQLLPLAVFV